MDPNDFASPRDIALFQLDGLETAFDDVAQFIGKKIKRKLNSDLRAARRGLKKRDDPAVDDAIEAFSARVDANKDVPNAFDNSVRNVTGILRSRAESFLFYFCGATNTTECNREPVPVP